MNIPTTNPWLLIEDFNEIILPSEVSGGPFSATRAIKLSKVMEDYGLMDLEGNGHRCTWFKKAEGA